MVMLTFKPTNIAGVSQFEFQADASITVFDLKELLSPQLGGLAPQSIRLVCAGRVWQDASTLESYKVSEGSIVHCLNNPQAPSTAGIASTQELQPANPMAQMMGMGMPMGGAGGSGDSMQQMMAQSQQMMQQNPEMMQQMMESPMVQQMMENPEVMRSIMQMNPQTRQLMEQHPEIARMMEDPETLRQSARMASNPSLMREMMRNQDTAMGRLDAMPGGHAALAAAHRDVIDPMHNAMSAGGDSNTSINQYSEDAQGHRNTAPLSNPWGAPQPAAQPAPSAPQSTPPAAGTPVDPMQQLMQMQSGGANPMAQMMQQGGANPMAQMMQNPQMMQQMMQNPQIQQMTQQMMQNPEMMQQMMQMSGGMFGQQPGGVNGADGTAQQPNPMANMMQQMMQNPQMMQQAMQMGQQMQGSAGMPGMFGAAAPATSNPPAHTTNNTDGTNAAAQLANPAMNQSVPAQQPNPMANMMQQMMQNPQMMQQAMQMRQQMQGGAGMPGMFGQYPMGQPSMFETPPAQTGAAMDEAAVAAAASNPMVRARFAQQLNAMLAMGFSDEQKCLQALVQCNGNVDSALDKMFAEN